MRIILFQVEPSTYNYDFSDETKHESDVELFDEKVEDVGSTFVLNSGNHLKQLYNFIPVVADVSSANVKGKNIELRSPESLSSEELSSGSDELNVFVCKNK